MLPRPRVRAAPPISLGVSLTRPIHPALRPPLRQGGRWVQVCPHRAAGTAGQVPDFPRGSSQQAGPGHGQDRTGWVGQERTGQGKAAGLEDLEVTVISERGRLPWRGVERAPVPVLCWFWSCWCCSALSPWCCHPGAVTLLVLAAGKKQPCACRAGECVAGGAPAEAPVRR